MSRAMRDKYLFCVSGHLCNIFQETGNFADKFAAAPSSQDKDESGFASIDELDPKSAKAWAHREDCVGNPRFEFRFGSF